MWGTLKKTPLLTLHSETPNSVGPSTRMVCFDVAPFMDIPMFSISYLTLHKVMVLKVRHCMVCASVKEIIHSLKHVGYLYV